MWVQRLLGAIIRSFTVHSNYTPIEEYSASSWWSRNGPPNMTSLDSATLSSGYRVSAFRTGVVPQDLLTLRSYRDLFYLLHSSYVAFPLTKQVSTRQHCQMQCTISTCNSMLLLTRFRLLRASHVGVLDVGKASPGLRRPGRRSSTFPSISPKGMELSSPLLC